MTEDNKPPKGKNLAGVVVLCTLDGRYDDRCHYYEDHELSHIGCNFFEQINNYPCCKNPVAIIKAMGDFLTKTWLDVGSDNPPKYRSDN